MSRWFIALVVAVLIATVAESEAPDAGTALPPPPVPGFAPAKAPRDTPRQPRAEVTAVDAGTPLPPPPVPGFAPARAPRPVEFQAPDAGTPSRR